MTIATTISVDDDTHPPPVVAQWHYLQASFRISRFRRAHATMMCCRYDLAPLSIICDAGIAPLDTPHCFRIAAYVPLATIVLSGGLDGLGQLQAAGVFAVAMP